MEDSKELSTVDWQKQLQDQFPGLTIKNTVGRPTKLTDKTIHNVCSYIEDGLSIEDACRLSDVSEDCYYEWMKKGKAGLAGFSNFAEAVKNAQAKFKHERLKHAVKSINKRDSWEGDITLLERKFPDEFGRDSKRIDETVKQSLDIIKDLINLKHAPATEADTKAPPDAIDGECTVIN